MTSHAVPLQVSAPTRERVLVQPAIDGLFLATILFVTFAKVHWELAADLSLADVLTAVFLVRLRLGPPRARRRALHANLDGRARVLCRVPPRLPGRVLQPRHRSGAHPVDEGDGEVRAPLRVPGRGRDPPLAPVPALLLVRARRVLRRDRAERGLRDRAARRRGGRPREPRRDPDPAAHGARYRRSTSSAR